MSHILYLQSQHFIAIFTAVLTVHFEMLTTFNDDPDLLKKIITGDELWMYGYDIENKVQSFQWRRPEEPRPKKARQV